MPALAAPFIRIGDGSTWITFADGTVGYASNYVCSRRPWEPSIAIYPYDLTEEEIICDVRGSDAATALANLRLLAAMLDQAESFNALNDVSPVRIEYVPQGSTVHTTSTPLKALIVGRAPGDQTHDLSVTPQFNDVGLYYEIQDVKIRFTRRGRWLGADDSLSTGTAESPTIVSGTFGTSHPTLSPVRVKVKGMLQKPQSPMENWILLIAGSTSRLVLLEGESAGTMANWSNVADTTAKAHGGSVLRYTPPDATQYIGGEISATSLASTCRLFALYGAIRNNTAAKTYTIQVAARCADAAGLNTDRALTDPIKVDATYVGTPLWYHLGVVAIPKALAALRIYIQASSSGGTIDFDCFILHALDDDRSAAYEVGCAGNTPSNAWSISIEHNYLTKPYPTSETKDETTANTDIGSLFAYQPPETRGDTIVGTLLALNVVAQYWNLTLGASPFNQTIDLIRSRAYIVPE